MFHTVDIIKVFNRFDTFIPCNRCGIPKRSTAKRSCIDLRSPLLAFRVLSELTFNLNKVINSFVIFKKKNKFNCSNLIISSSLRSLFSPDKLFV